MLPGLESILPALPSLAGMFGKSGGSTRTSVSQSTNVSLAVNPVIANQYGDGGFTASPSGNATGYPTSNANASGNDGLPSGYGGLGSGSYPTGYGSGYSNSVTPPIATQSDGAGMVLLAGGAALLLLLFND